MTGLGISDIGTGVYNLAAPLFGGTRVPLPSEVIRGAGEKIGIARAPETPGQQVYSDVLGAVAGGGAAATPSGGAARAGRTEPNSADDEVLVLFTSGTTGSKKLVPHVMGDMLTASATIALSWDLSPSDVNCNLMPLFHVGGIVRQIFSPVFSGGCVICCPNFDPSTFWALLAKKAFTWYYAAPTMHQLILSTGKSDGMIGEGGECSMKLRMIANAAGGLLPSLAKEMYQVFDATVSS